MKKVGNRKSTRGRNVYYQVIEWVNKEGLKCKRTIKHVQDSFKKLKAAESLFDFEQKYYKAPKGASERTLSRKRERTVGRLVWNSSEQGTYVRAVHGELK